MNLTEVLLEKDNVPIFMCEKRLVKRIPSITIPHYGIEKRQKKEKLHKSNSQRAKLFEYAIYVIIVRMKWNYR